MCGHLRLNALMQMAFPCHSKTTHQKHMAFIDGWRWIDRTYDRNSKESYA